MEYSCSTNNNTQVNFNLPTTIRNIVFYYIKAHYNKYLQEHNLTSIPKDELSSVVSELYDKNSLDLKKYIRGTMRKNFPDYDQNFTLKTSTEEIILEMYDDPEYSKNRLVLEIESHQNNN
jgi:cytochrome c